MCMVRRHCALAKPLSTDFSFAPRLFCAIHDTLMDRRILGKIIDERKTKIV
jgi:hypothetical protein